MKQRRITVMNIGSACFITVFAVLCLTVFAVLSAVTAGNEWRLARRTAESVKAYYDAERYAVEVMNDVCSKYNGEFVSPKDVNADVWVSDECEYLSYSVPIDDLRKISVVLRCEDEQIKIEHWAVELAWEVMPDEFIEVWDGNKTGG